MFCLTIHASFLTIDAIAGDLPTTSMMRVTGAWVQLLADWLDHERLHAPELRAAIVAHANADAVPIARWQNWLERAVALCPQRIAPALDIGARVAPRHVGVLGYLVASAGTLGEAVAAYRRYERLFYGVDIVQTIVHRDEIELCWPPSDPPLGHLADSVAIAALVSFLRRQLDAAPAPTRIAFIHPPVAAHEQAAYEAFFGCPVLFGDRHTRVCFPAAYLALPMRQADPQLRDLLDRQAQALLQALPDPDPFDRALRNVLLRLLPEGAATLPRAARELHTSVRSVQRRLAARDLSWQQVLDQTRARLAHDYLHDRALSLGDIALLLGYSEQSAFTRAFRRWTGTTPQHVRAAADRTRGASRRAR